LMPSKEAFAYSRSTGNWSLVGGCVNRPSSGSSERPDPSGDSPGARDEFEPKPKKP
jgi:hypothetical protein